MSARSSPYGPLRCLAPLLAFAALAAPAAGADLDLEGSWYVLIHYRDSATANPDVDRWDDRIWTFEPKGSRLQWTEYPIVVFKDQRGRFGPVGRNPRARILHAWEPNVEQQAEIDAGLQANSRGMKTKSLRGSAKRGYKSTGSARSVSAMTVGYQETWSIDQPATMPVFTRDDVMGTEASMAKGGKGDGFSGRTRYTAEAVSSDGRLITGRFARDENRSGTFRMMRAGAPRDLESDGRTPNQKQRDRFQEMIEAGVQDEAHRQFLASLDEAGVGDAPARIGVDELDRIWRRYEARVIGGDERAARELSEAVRDAYTEAVARDLAKSVLADGADLEAELVELGLEVSDAELERARQLRRALGEERMAALREEYGARVRAGDEQALGGLREAVRRDYADYLTRTVSQRIESGDAEAVRQWREYQRLQRDRRL